MVLLLWWLVVGPRFHGRSFRLGCNQSGLVSWCDPGKTVAITLTDKFIAELLEEVEQKLRAVAVPAGRFRKVADKTEWAASVVP